MDASDTESEALTGRWEYERNRVPWEIGREFLTLLVTFGVAKYF